MAALNGSLIKMRRKELKLSQGELAEMLGYADKSMVSRIETGKLDDIPLSAVVKLSNVLQMEINNIVVGGYKMEECS